MKFLACRTILALGLLAIGSMTKGDAPPHVVSDVQVVLHRDYATTAAFTPDGKRLFVSTDDGIFVWDGNYYALAVTERLGVESQGGMVRIGAVHYNTVDEIHRLGAALRNLI